MNIMEYQTICSKAAEQEIKEEFGIDVFFFTCCDIYKICYNIAIEIIKKERPNFCVQIGQLEEKDFTTDNLVKLFKIWWNKQNRKEVIKLRIKTNICECCGGRLKDLKCEYCGVEYYTEEAFNDR